MKNFIKAVVFGVFIGCCLPLSATFFISKERCLSEYLEAYRDFEPESQYVTLDHKLGHNHETRIETYQWKTSGDNNKLKRYVKALAALNSNLNQQIAIKSSMMGIAGALINKLLANMLINHKIALGLLGAGTNIALVVHENKSISSDPIPYFDLNTLKKESDLCSNKNLDGLLGKSAISLLISGTSLVITKFLLDNIN